MVAGAMKRDYTVSAYSHVAGVPHTDAIGPWTNVYAPDQHSQTNVYTPDPFSPLPSTGVIGRKSLVQIACVEAELAMRGTNALQALSNGLTNKTIVATGLSTPCAEVGNICKFRIENVTQPTVLYLSVYNDDICEAIIRKMRVTPKGQP